MKLDTLDILPNEGMEEIVTRRLTRRECEECGNPAHVKLTYLLPNCRSNPASSAYRHDDCSWCSDYEMFLCKECFAVHNGWHPAKSGYEPCSAIPANVHFAHLFLEWKKV